MNLSFRRWILLPGAILSLLWAQALAPAAADTTVDDYLKLEKRGQAHLLGTMLQTLADDLQANDKDKEAQCLAALYTEKSEVRVTRSPGMMDFLQSVEIAREDNPQKTTLEEIIARQLVEYCGYGEK